MMLLLSTMMWLLVSTASISRPLLGRQRLAALQIHVDPALILFRPVLQAELLTHLLHPRLDHLDITRAVVALTDNHVQVRLARAARRSDPRLDNIFRLAAKLTVQIYRIRRHAILCIVLFEDKVRRLLVVFGHFGAVRLPFVGERLCGRAVAALVGGAAALEALAAFASFLAGEVAQVVVVALGVGMGTLTSDCWEAERISFGVALTRGKAQGRWDSRREPTCFMPLLISYDMFAAGCVPSRDGGKRQGEATLEYETQAVKERVWYKRVTTSAVRRA